MCVTVCGRFCLNEGGVAGYVNRMKVKYAAKWGVQIAGMIFQTRSRFGSMLYMWDSLENSRYPARKQTAPFAATLCGRLGQALKSDANYDYIHEGPLTLVNIVVVGG